jgi:uncharacterized SAM-binding protein YcdF (DUF218 family)
MLFGLKKLLGVFLTPCPLGLLLTLLGLMLLGRGRLQAGQRLAWLGVGLLFAFASGPVSWWMMRELEAPYRVVALSTDAPRPSAVVVLGGGHHRDPSRPPNFELSDVTTVRLVEGIRLWNLYPEAALIVSGGQGQAEALARTAVGLGVPEAKIEREGDSLDTADEARFLRTRLQGQPFLLVTSAAHMRRSLELFRAQGLTPTPAPADFLAVADSDAGPVWPTSSGLVLAERALHEFWGMIWLRLRPGSGG